MGAKSLIIATAHNHLNGSLIKRGAMAILCSALLWFSVSTGHAQQAATAASSGGPSYAALADLLENPQTREQLVGQLRTLAAQPDPATAPTDRTAADNPDSATPAQAEPDSSIPGELQMFATGLQGDIAETWQVLKALVTGQPLPGARADQWQSAAISLGIAMVSVLIAYFILRLVAGYAFGRLNDWIMRDDGKRSRSTGNREGAGTASRKRLGKLGSLTLGRKLVAVILAFAIDIAATVLAALAA
jgi:hypothetical protein